MPDYKERVNIGVRAKKLYSGEHQHSFSSVPSVDNSVVPNSEKAYRLYAQFKPELFAIGAVFADDAVQFVYEQRDLGELMASLDPMRPFFSIGQHIRKDVIAAIYYQDKALKEGEEEPGRVSAYNRLQELVEREHRLVPEIRQGLGAAYFLEGGTNTAVETMSNVLGVIPYVAGSIDDSQRLISVAENSFPFVASLASAHGEATMLVVNALKGTTFPFTPYIPEYFIIEKYGEKERLALSDRGKEIVRNVLGTEKVTDFRSSNSPTIGCLAMVNFRGGSAVQKIWDWHMEAARAIYPKLARGTK